MDNEDIQTAIEVLEELQEEYESEDDDDVSDEYADISQTIHYLRQKRNE